MTIEMITAKFDTIAADAEYSVDGNMIDLTINNFEGFDEDWNEVYRELENEEAVDAVLEWLDDNADHQEGDLYHYYYFGDISVCVGWTSYDI